MTFRQFTFNNVLRNKRLYAAYFLSSLFSVLIFFVYAIFAFHPSLGDDNLGNTVSMGLHTAEGIIYVFSFFFILYSMASFLKSRQREFGLMIMHGMTPFQLRKMIFWENMLIGCGATAGGVGIGLIFAKAILLLAENVLRLDTSLPFYIPGKAMLLTVCAFLVLFAVISIFTVFMVRNKEIIELIKGGKKPRPEPKASWLLSLLAVFLIGGGYITSILVEGMVVALAFIPVTIMVIIGTYFLFTQLSVFIITRLKRRPNFFWRKTNLLTLADLSFRMKDNARTFFIVSIVSTVAFCAIGSLFGFKSIITQQITAGHPFAIELVNNAAKTADQSNEINEVNRVLQELNISGSYYTLDMHAWSVKEGRRGTITIVPESIYNQFADVKRLPKLELKEGESAVIFDPFYVNVQNYNVKSSHELKSGMKISPTIHLVKSPMPDQIEPVFIIPDTQYSSLPPANEKINYAMWDIPSRSDELKAGEAISSNQLLTDSSSNIYTVAYSVNQVLRVYYAVLFIGLFIGVVFFVAAGSFLYFRLYTDLDDDKQKFAAIAKIGLSAGELSKVITRQLILLFFAPIAIALVHGIIALGALQNMFYSSIFKESVMVLGSFLAIQIVYFLLVRYFYVLNIRRSCNL